MITFNGLILLSIIFIAVSFIACVFINYFLFKRKNPNSKFSFFNVFIYEGSLVGNEFSIFYKTSLLFFSLFLITPLLVTLNDLYILGNLYFYIILIAIGNLASLIGIVGVSFIEAKFVNPHTTASTILFCGTLFSQLSSIILFYFINSLTGTVNSLVCLIIFICLAIVSLGLILNPRLKDWPRLLKKEENGEYVLVRPKVVSLAFAEWIFFFLNMINVIVFFIGVLC